MIVCKILGSPIRHIENAQNGREKGGRWSISALFRKKSATTKGLGSGDMTENTYIHNNGNMGEPNGIIRRGSDAHQHRPMDTPPPLPPRASSKGRIVGPPTIFPHLKPDFMYPDSQPAGQGFYYHPNYGYVRRGSYSDNQVYIAINLLGYDISIL